MVNKYLFTFGGSTVGGKFTSQIFRIDAEKLEKWEVVGVKAGKFLDLRLMGHSCVAFNQTILVFGGITTDMAKFSKLSQKLFLFLWSDIKTSGTLTPPEMAGKQVLVHIWWFNCWRQIHLSNIQN